jgi:hypothetical protein
MNRPTYHLFIVVTFSHGRYQKIIQQRPEMLSKALHADLEFRILFSTKNCSKLLYRDCSNFIVLVCELLAFLFHLRDL